MNAKKLTAKKWHSYSRYKQEAVQAPCSQVRRDNQVCLSDVSTHFFEGHVGGHAMGTPECKDSF
jgi:hypothetical protein